MLRVVEAEVVERVARRVHRDPLAPGELHALAVPDAPGRVGRREQHAAAPGSSPGACNGGIGCLLPPHGVSPPHGTDWRWRSRVGSSRSGSPVSSQSSARSRRRSGSRRRARRRSRRPRRRPARAARPRLGEQACAASRLRSSDHVVNARCVTSSAPASLRDAAGAAEVVGVRVRDDDGVDVAELEAGGLQPRASAPSTTAARGGRGRRRRGRGRRGGRTCSRGRARHPDRQLHPHDAGRDLDDLLGRRLLLLLLRLRRPGCPRRGRPADAPRRSRPILLDHPVKPSGRGSAPRHSYAERRELRPRTQPLEERAGAEAEVVARGGGATTWSATGRPSTSPTGMLAAGWPVMLNGAVNAADKPIRFTSLPATVADQRPLGAERGRRRRRREEQVDLLDQIARRRRASARGAGGSPCTSRSVAGSSSARRRRGAPRRARRGARSRSRDGTRPCSATTTAPTPRPGLGSSTGTSTSSRPASSTSDIAASCATFSTSGSVPA